MDLTIKLNLVAAIISCLMIAWFAFGERKDTQRSDDNLFAYISYLAWLVGIIFFYAALVATLPPMLYLMILDVSNYAILMGTLFLFSNKKSNEFIKSKEFNLLIFGFVAVECWDLLAFINCTEGCTPSEKVMYMSPSVALSTVAFCGFAAAAIYKFKINALPLLIIGVTYSIFQLPSYFALFEIGSSSVANDSVFYVLAAGKVLFTFSVIATFENEKIPTWATTKALSAVNIIYATVAIVMKLSVSIS